MIQHDRKHLSFISNAVVCSNTVDKLIKENSDLFSDAQCKVCSAVLISDSQKLAHYQVRIFSTVVAIAVIGNLNARLDMLVNISAIVATSGGWWLKRSMKLGGSGAYTA